MEMLGLHVSKSLLGSPLRLSIGMMTTGTPGKDGISPKGKKCRDMLSMHKLYNVEHFLSCLSSPLRYRQMAICDGNAGLENAQDGQLQSHHFGLHRHHRT